MMNVQYFAVAKVTTDELDKEGRLQKKLETTTDDYNQQDPEINDGRRSSNDSVLVIECEIHEQGTL